MHIIKESWKRLWNAQEIRTLVLLSLCLQFCLVFLAPWRKRTSHKLLIVPLWLFYLSADYVAILALGNILSQQIEGTTDHLKAFWAPFLLLHLGGPDTITSYSLEDNELWLRHFLGLAVQVFVAFMVLLYLWAVSGLRIAATLVFIVGLVKYGERTWALRYVSMNQQSHLFVNLRKQIYIGTLPELLPPELPSSDNNVSEVIQITDAYNFFIESLQVFVEWERLYMSFQDDFFIFIGASRASKLVEIELSFLYDLLHTKAIHIHTLRGYLWRCISLGMISIAFILFVLSEKRGYAKDDIIISYVLLGSALFMELISLLLIIMSDWMIVALRHKHDHEPYTISTFLKDYNPRKLAVGIASVMLYFFPKGKPRWSNSMAQYNLLNHALGHKGTDVRRILKELESKKLRDKFVTFKVKKLWKKFVAFKVKLWEKFVFVQSVRVPSELMEFLFEKLKTRQIPSSFLKKKKKKAQEQACETDMYSFTEIGNRRRKDELLEEVRKLLSRNIQGLNETIILWHIATDIWYYTDHTQASVNENDNAGKGVFQRIRHFLNHCSKNDRSKSNQSDGEISKSNQSDGEISLLISNYMLYLLIMQPSMMSVRIDRLVFDQTFNDTCAEFVEYRGEGLTTLEARKMLLNITSEETQKKEDVSVLSNACILANHLKSFTEEERWSIIGGVWTDVLCFAAVNCKVDNHAKQLSQGGEFLTHVWLMLIHMRLDKKYRIQSQDAFRTLFSIQPVESEPEPEPESESESEY